jgi:predicted RNA-binding protein with PIN domain
MTADDGERDAGQEGRGPRWLVDGMNLIGSRPDRWWNDRDRAVRRLVGELDRYASATGEEVTVVFDRRPPDLAAGPHGGVLVGFASRHGRDAADHEIVELVAADQDPGTLRVVTSDRRLVDRVRQLGARVTGASAFRRHLDRILADIPPESRQAGGDPDTL